MQEIIIYDAEYWADAGSMQRQWQGPNDHPPYLVQLSAVKVKLDAHLTQTEAFSVYVQPQDPQGNTIPLTAYFEQLTGITTAHLNQEAIPIADAFKKLTSFFDDHICYSYGGDEKTIAISANHWQQNLPMDIIKCRDVKDILKKAGMSQKDLNSQSSGTLAQFHGLPFTGHVHNAADDVTSILLTLRHYLNLGKITPLDFK
jgi:DNA polymerase III epsilon subunit-like protein